MSTFVGLQAMRAGRVLGSYYFDSTTHSVVKIGRQAAADIEINDPMAARLHAVIEFSDQRVILRDMGSFAGTAVNGARVRTVTLSENDQITVGDTVLHVTVQGERGVQLQPAGGEGTVPEVLLHKLSTLTPQALDLVEEWVDTLRADHHRVSSLSSQQPPVEDHPWAAIKLDGQAIEAIKDHGHAPNDVSLDREIYDTPALVEQVQREHRRHIKGVVLLSLGMIALGVVAVVVATSGDSIARRALNAIKPTAAPLVLPLPEVTAVAPDAEAELAETIYVVKPGDSLSAIAAHFWGEMSKAELIFAANRDVIDDPARIEVGMRLRIP